MEPNRLPAPGELVDGKFRVEGPIATGGMAVVLAATHVQLRERVAIKVLLPSLANESDTRRRFMREARAAFRIKGEHVARVLDVGELRSGLPYMVLEYLDGASLADELAQKGKLSLRDAVDYVLQVCEALAEAHALGIIHRDIKPSNLFLIRKPDGSPFVKVLDFGVSKDLHTRTSGMVTVPGAAQVLGSPLFMAPEQLMWASDVDARADVWSLGVVLYQLVAGAAPFEADSLADLCAAILHASPADPRRVTPELPAAFVDVLLRCLAKERGERFPNVAELARALLPFGPEVAGDRARRIGRILGETKAEATDPGATTRTRTRTPKPDALVPRLSRTFRHVWRSRAWLAGGVATGALAAIAWAVTRPEPHVATPAPTHVARPAAVESGPADEIQSTAQGPVAPQRTPEASAPAMPAATEPADGERPTQRARRSKPRKNPLGVTIK